MRRLARLLAPLALVAFPLAGRPAAAGNPPAPPAGPKPADGADPDGAKAGEKTAPEPAYKGPEIQWRTSFADALEEARERNLLVYLHSHGST